MICRVIWTFNENDKKNSIITFRPAGRGSLLTGTKFAVRLIELPFTLQHDREIMFRFHFMCNLEKRVIFTRGVLSIPTCDVYVGLETTGAAMKIARGTTNNQ